MPAYAAVKHLFFALSCWLFSSVSYAEPHFNITQASIQSQGESHYLLYATIAYPLTPRVIEAIENGIPITFTQTLRISTPYLFIGQILPWRQTQWSTIFHHQLRYHSLSGQYILQSFSPKQQHNFPDLDLALNYMGKLDGLAISLPELSTPHAQLELKTEIDIHALPTPMRPGALISSKWQIASPWTRIAWPD